jgi:ABC-type sugar transport system permease subunit
VAALHAFWISWVRNHNVDYQMDECLVLKPFAKLFSQDRLMRIVLVRCLASMVLGVAFTVLLGYLFSIQSFYHWPQSVPMAIPTALCFVATGFALLGLSFLVRKK